MHDRVELVAQPEIERRSVARRPAVAVSQLTESVGGPGYRCDVELWIACVSLIANALVVRAGNAEDVQPVVAGVEIRSEHLLLLPREAERAVEEQRRFERPRRAGGRLIHFRVAAGIRG